MGCGWWLVDIFDKSISPFSVAYCHHQLQYIAEICLKFSRCHFPQVHHRQNHQLPQETVTPHHLHSRGYHALFLHFGRCPILQIPYHPPLPLSMQPGDQRRYQQIHSPADCQKKCKIDWQPFMLQEMLGYHLHHLWAVWDLWQALEVLEAWGQ